MTQTAPDLGLFRPAHDENSAHYRALLVTIRDQITALLGDAPTPDPMPTPTLTPEVRAQLAVRRARDEHGLGYSKMAVLAADDPAWRWKGEPCTASFSVLYNGTAPFIKNSEKLALIARVLDAHCDALLQD